MSVYTAPDNSPIRTPYRVLKTLNRGPKTATEVMDELGLGKVDTALRHLNAAYDEGLVCRHVIAKFGPVFQYEYSLA